MTSDRYVGAIIEESLENKVVLGQVRSTSTVAEAVTEADATPWLKWTRHKAVVDEQPTDSVAELLSKSLNPNEAWYADYKNDRYHYVIFRGQVFKVDRIDAGQYAEVKAYGIAQGIPSFQMDIS